MNGHNINDINIYEKEAMCCLKLFETYAVLSRYDKIFKNYILLNK